MMFTQVDAWPGDPILSLQAQFLGDQRAEKINLGIRLYYDEQGCVPKLGSITEAQYRLHQADTGASLYLPMSGMATLCAASEKLLFGDNHSLITLEKVATIQTLGADRKSVV